MKYEIRIPKDELIESFGIYVLNPINTDNLFDTESHKYRQDFNDKYLEFTRIESIEFDPSRLVIDLHNQEILEDESNKIQTTLFEYEHIANKVQVLYESLVREEEIYKAQLYENANATKWKAVSDRTAHILAQSLSDPVGQKFWAYIGKAKNDLAELRIITKALTNHMFKCKMIYQARYSGMRYKDQAVNFGE